MEAEERATVTLALGSWTWTWPLPAHTGDDLALVDALARLALAARRAGGDLRIDGPPPPLAALVELCGLRPVLLRAGAIPSRRWATGRSPSGSLALVRLARLALEPPTLEVAPRA